jgi:hypothetical protein
LLSAMPSCSTFMMDRQVSRPGGIMGWVGRESKGFGGAGFGGERIAGRVWGGSSAVQGVVF